tara:strand:- start:36 stop:518 length:483 start_codon:yes stop_codon:yes gene_type:complete
MGLENWKDIPNYIGYYQVSDKGNVRSVDRYVKGAYNNVRLLKGRLKPLQKHPDGYLQIRLSRYGLTKTFKNYQLVAYAFLNHTPRGHKLVVDHIDNNPLNNNLSNLQIITHIENTQKDKKSLGVSYHKSSNKWRAYKSVNKKQISLGYYNTKEEAINLNK